VLQAAEINRRQYEPSQAHAYCIEQQRRDVEQAMVSFNQDEAAALKPGLHAAELQWDGMQRFALRAHREWLEQKCTEAVNKRASCMADFQKARQERESLERLRQQQWEIYQNEAALLEQRRLDDLFLARQFSADRSHHQS